MSDEIATIPVEPKVIVQNGGDSSFVGVSVRAWLAIILVVTVCAMAVLGKAVEEPLYTLATVAIGFYFGQKLK